MTFANRAPDLSKKWQSRFWFGYPGTRSDQSDTIYVDESVILSDGSTIDPFAASVPGLLDIQAALFGNRNYPSLPHKLYSAGVLTTFPSFHADFGYFEIVMKAPAGRGAWPWFGCYPFNDAANYAAKLVKGTTRELDFLEGSGSQPNYIYTSTHDYVGTTQGNLGTYNDHYPDGTLFPDLSADFHTYGFDFSPGLLMPYLDQRPTLATPKIIPADFDCPWYLCISHDVDRATAPAWPSNEPDPTTYPKSWQIKSITALKTGATKIIGGSAALLAA